MLNSTMISNSFKRSFISFRAYLDIRLQSIQTNFSNMDIQNKKWSYVVILSILLEKQKKISKFKEVSVERGQQLLDLYHLVHSL